MKRLGHILVVFLVSACSPGSEQASHAPPESARACPEGMVLIPGGDYLLGQTITVPPWDASVEPTPPEGYWSLPNPAATVVVKPFCIDTFEYPNKRGAMPRARVDSGEASRLCMEVGKRLASRIEWQAAAQGKAGHLYSYGSKFEKDRCNTGARSGSFEHIASSGSFPRCHSPLGVFDLNGNVSEWVEDDWAGPWQVNELWGGPGAASRTVMGGTAWRGDMYGQDSTSRHRHHPEGGWEDDGFRCARNTLVVDPDES
jgi:formylglycine-generating enzyme required for sulfatase activity